MDEPNTTTEPVPAEVDDTPDLPPDPTGRGWAIPKHLVVRRIF